MPLLRASSVPGQELHRHIPKCAFTLLELLVVAAMVTVLAALLLPLLARAKTSALTAACRSNLRQLGMGFNLYVNEFQAYPQQHAEGVVPYVGEKPNTIAWRWQPLAPYHSVYNCPSYDQLPAWHGLYPPVCGSYGYNFGGVALTPDGRAYSGLGLSGVNAPIPSNWDFSLVPPIRAAQVVHPVNMIAMSDSIIDHMYNGTQFYTQGEPDLYLMKIPDISTFGQTGIRPAGWRDDVYQRRHNARFNVLFCDGHVETLKISDFLSIRSDDILARWNNDGLAHRDLVGDFESRGL